MWLILTGLAVLSRALYGVLTKVLSNFIKVGFITQTALLMVAGTIWGLLLSPFVGGIHLAGIGSVWLVLVIAIVTSALGNVLYFKGIATLESGTTQIAFSSIVIWSVIMAWAFLGTHLSLVQALGVLLLLFAILLAQYQKGSLKAKPGIWMIVASAACFAGFQIASARLSHTMTPGTYLVLAYLGDTILIGLPYLKSIKRDLMAKGAKLGGLFITVAITGALSILFNVFAYYSYKMAPDAGIVVLLLTTQVVLAVILSILFLKERSNIGFKLTAGALALVAAIMIKS